MVDFARQSSVQFHLRLELFRFWIAIASPRSGIVDARSTRVTDHRLVKLLVWYDNEWGYANRLVERQGPRGVAAR